VRTQLDIFHRAKTEWIADARRTAQKLLFRRELVSIEDVLAECPRPKGVSKKANSQVFKHDVFRPVGYTRATHPEANGHVIRLWELREQFYDSSMLRSRRRFEAEDVR
jgi:hypothetical protein